MTETAVKDQVCRHCGAEIRPDTQFCYNCGGSLAPENGNGLKDSRKIIESNNIVESKPTTKLKSDKTADAAILESEIVEESKVETEPKLKSAAAMRRKSKVFTPKQTEIIWEEHENAPNVWFVLAALFLTIAAIVIYYIASYLK